MAANRVKLTICGANYVIVSEDEESYVQELGTRLDEDMNEVEYEGEGLLARAFCHEIDHLDGHMYTELVEGELHQVSYDEDEE